MQDAWGVMVVVVLLLLLLVTVCLPGHTHTYTTHNPPPTQAVISEQSEGAAQAAREHDAKVAKLLEDHSQTLAHTKKQEQVSE